MPGPSGRLLARQAAIKEILPLYARFFSGDDLVRGLRPGELVPTRHSPPSLLRVPQHTQRRPVAQTS